MDAELRLREPLAARVTVTIVAESQSQRGTFASRPSRCGISARVAGDGRPGRRLGVHLSDGERERRLRRASRRASSIWSG
jgi:hypothetical protein